MKTIPGKKSATGVKLTSQLQAGVKCQLYIAPDGGNWKNCLTQCNTDNYCRYLADKFAFHSDADYAAYENHLDGCLQYWCAGQHNYHGKWTNKNGETRQY